MRLAFFVQMLDPQDSIRGFIPGWLSAIAKEVDELVVISQETKDFEASSLGPNVTIFSLGKEEKLGKLAQWMRLSNILCCGAGPIDALITHMNPSYSIGAKPICLMKGIPIYTWYAHKEVSSQLKWALRFSRLCFSASEESFRLQSPKRKIIGHGIDLEHFALDSNLPEGLKIISACRLSPVKRVDLLLDSLSELKGDWQAVIAGDAGKEDQTDYAQQLKTQSEGVGDKVSWQGEVSYQDMPALLSEGNLYVNLSDTGSLDKGLLEAVARGLNVLTSNVAFKTFLEGTTDRTFIASPSKESLVKRLEELRDLPAETLSADRAILQKRLEENHSLQGLAKRLVGEIKGSL